MHINMPNLIFNISPSRFRTPGLRRGGSSLPRHPSPPAPSFLFRLDLKIPSLSRPQGPAFLAWLLPELIPCIQPTEEQRLWLDLGCLQFQVSSPLVLQFFRQQNIPVGFVKSLSHPCLVIMEEPGSQSLGRF